MGKWKGGGRRIDQVINSSIHILPDLWILVKRKNYIGYWHKRRGMCRGTGV